MIIEGFVIAAIYLVPFFSLLVVGELIVEYVFPRVPFLNKWFESLIGDGYEDDDE